LDESPAPGRLFWLKVIKVDETGMAERDISEQKVRNPGLSKRSKLMKSQKSMASLVSFNHFDNSGLLAQKVVQKRVELLPNSETGKEQKVKKPAWTRLKPGGNPLQEASLPKTNSETGNSPERQSGPP